MRLHKLVFTIVWIYLFFGVAVRQACAVPVSSTSLTLESGGVPVTSVVPGSVVTLTATVTMFSGTAAVTPGQVKFCDASAAYCTDIHLLATTQLTPAGVATFRFVPGAGNHSYKAVFVNTGAVMGSSSATVSLAVGPSVGAPALAATTIASSGGYGDYSLTATVTGAGTPFPTGIVSFLDTSNANYVLGTASLGAGAGGLSLLHGATYPTGVLPSSIVTADFNGDGILDIATANTNSMGPYAPGSLTILLGKGDGTFTAAPSITTGVDPSFLVTADFNGDGIPDLAFASIVDGNITILLGIGDGTFRVAGPSPIAGVFSDVFSLAVGDFDGDGNEDLVAANPNTQSVIVLLGHGDGTFTQVAQQPATGDNPAQIGVGDFNGDGKLDLAICNVFASPGSSAPSNVTILLGNGDGTFTAAPSVPVGIAPESIAVADFNGDGKLDLAVVNIGLPGTVSVLLGNGDGTFAAPGNTIPIVYLNSFAIGDFNGDGRADIATFLSTDQVPNVDVLLGNGDATFASVTGSGPDIATYGVAGDFNGDGRTDLAVSNQINGVAIMLTEWSGAATATVHHISPVGEGMHLVDASYAGDPVYASGISGTTPLIAAPQPTTSVLTANPAGSVSGQQVTLTATMAPDAAQNHNATGAVTFYDGGWSLGTGTISNGVATLTTASLATGLHSLQAAYAGDRDFEASASNAVPFDVLPFTPPPGLIEPVGSTSPVQTATLTFSAAGTLDTIAVLTQGAPNLDFNYVHGGSCAVGTAYAAGQTCTVEFSFRPTVPGIRYGGVRLSTSAGAVLGSGYIHGTGVGPQVNYLPGTQSTLVRGSTQPGGMAFDGAGNLFIADGSSGLVREATVSSGYTTLLPIGSGFMDPDGLAVDGLGNVYVADFTGGTVSEVMAAGGYGVVVPLATGLVSPSGVAVDPTGNVFYTDRQTNLVVELSPGQTPRRLGGSFASPSGIGIDGSGNLFVLNGDDASLTELPIATNYTSFVELPASVAFAAGLAVNSNGDLFVVNPGLSAVYEIQASGGYRTIRTVANPPYPVSLALDGNGNLFVSDNSTRTVLKYDYSDAPTLTFAPTALGLVSADSPQTISITNNGNADLVFSVPSAGNNPSITPGFLIGTGSTCPQLTAGASTGTLAPDNFCTDLISSQPVASGTNSGTLVTTDNNLSVPGAFQIVLLDDGGGGTIAVPFITSVTPSSGPVAGGTVVTITGTSFTGATAVNFGASAATSFTVNSDTSITATSPGGNRTVDITVTTPGGTSATGASDAFTYILLLSQTISFPQPAATAYAGTTVVLSATGGTSGNPVVFSVLSGPATVSGTNGSTLTYTGPGTVTIEADQAGDATYNAAPPVQQTVTVTVLTEPLTTTSAAVSTVVTFSAAGTLGAIGALTQGKANLDFSIVPGGDCAVGQTYAAGQTCTVEFSFTPTRPGLRYGAVSLATSAGATLGNGYIYGIGTGPQVIFTTGVQTSLGTGGSSPTGVAVDGNGNIFISDIGNNSVEEILASDGSTRTLGTFPLPDDVAVDGSGNVFVISDRTTLSEILAVNGSVPASPTILTLYTGFNALNGVKVDANGNVFVANSFSAGADSMVEEVLAVNGSIPPSPTVVTVVSGIGGPTGVAIDVSGNVYFSDEDGNAVYEVMAVNGVIPPSPTTRLLASGLMQPTNVALDGVGDVFVPNFGDSTVKEILAVNGVIPASPTVVTLTTTFGAPQGLTVDSSGNVLIADSAKTQIVKLDFADPPSLTFATTDVGSTSTDSPQTVTLTNDGNAPLEFALPGAGGNPSITPGFIIGNSSTCPQLSGSSGPATLAAGASCTDVISFTPITGGPDRGDLITTDDDLNISGSTQVVPLNGIGIAPAVLVLTASPTTAAFGTPVTLTVTATAAPPSTGTPTGSIAFFNNGAAIGTAPLNPAGVAVLATSTLPVGADTITCTYSGDPNFAPAICNAVVVNITAAPTALTIASSANPSPALTPVTFTAHMTINGQPAGAGNAIVFSVAALPGTAVVAFPVTTDATGAASFTPSGFYPGAYAISATFAATADYQASSSAAITETVNLNPTSTALTASPNPAEQNQAITFIATVTALTGTAPPNGTVTLLDGATPLGTTSALYGAGAFSTATFTFSTLAPGLHSFSAVYTPTAGNSGLNIAGIPFGNSIGAVSFTTSGSSGVSVTITPQDFSLTANPPSITIETQHHRTMQLTLTSTGGWTGPITLTCGSVPAWVTCELPSSPVVLGANATLPVNFTIDTDQLLGFLASAAPQPPRTPPFGRIALATLLPLTLLGFARRRKALHSMLMLATLAAFLCGMTACGGNLYPNHTAPGVYNIPVTGTGTAVGATTPTTHTLNITLTVTP